MEMQSYYADAFCGIVSHLLSDRPPRPIPLSSSSRASEQDGERKSNKVNILRARNKDHSAKVIRSNQTFMIN